jgi:hypothetical protein
MKRVPLLLLVGLGLLAVGCGPLLLFLAADTLGMIRDPNPNPVGLGIIFFVTIWPAIGCTVLGLLQLAWRWVR